MERADLAAELRRLAAEAEPERNAARAVALDTLDLENRQAWGAILARLTEAGVAPRDLYRARTIACRPVASAAE